MEGRTTDPRSGPVMNPNLAECHVAANPDVAVAGCDPG
jgi:hypothetical protein